MEQEQKIKEYTKESDFFPFTSFSQEGSYLLTPWKYRWEIQMQRGSWCRQEQKRNWHPLSHWCKFPRVELQRLYSSLTGVIFICVISWTGRVDGYRGSHEGEIYFSHRMQRTASIRMPTLIWGIPRRKLTDRGISDGAPPSGRSTYCTIPCNRCPSPEHQSLKSIHCLRSLSETKTTPEKKLIQWWNMSLLAPISLFKKWENLGSFHIFIWPKENLFFFHIFKAQSSSSTHMQPRISDLLQ